MVVVIGAVCSRPTMIIIHLSVVRLSLRCLLLCTGGTKVDAFVYSPLLSGVAGSTYSGLMHVSDWFPTILGFAGIIDYVPGDGYSLDGLDQSAAIATADATACPRDFMLYNAYVDIGSYDIFTNGSVAARNERYKLIHAYINNPSSIWYTGDLLADDAAADDGVGGPACDQYQAMEGNFTYFLFDLWEDPNEMNNLYGREDLVEIQVDTMLCCAVRACCCCCTLTCPVVCFSRPLCSTTKLFGYYI